MDEMTDTHLYPLTVPMRWARRRARLLVGRDRLLHQRVNQRVRPPLGSDGTKPPSRWVILDV